MDAPQPPSATLKCPNCGGDANPGDVRCSWCQGSLATLACASCFATIFVGMKHCPWCGAEVAKAEVLRQKAEACPHCGTGMRWVQLGASQLSECETCGGVWASTESFEKICQDREQQEAVLGRPGVDMESMDFRGKPRRVYVPCPICQKLMNRMNFAGCSGVVVDWCKDHGTWLDHTELPQVIAFIRSGGLKKARDREKEALLSESRRLKMRELQLATREGRPIQEASALSWKDDPDSLLDLLSSMWRGLRA
jgi:Zn-finger nucleic acid-binding protein